MRGAALAAFLCSSLVGCGSAGKAQPAEVEISWPDAAVSNGVAAPLAASDAGPVELEPTSDAQPSPEGAK